MSEPDSDNKQLPKPSPSSKKIIKRIKKVENATLKHTHKFLIRRWDNVREVRAKVVLWIIVMGILIATTGFQMMWFQNSYLTTIPAKNSTYVEAVLGPVETLNPLYASSSAELASSQLLFSSLMKYDTTGKLNYDLIKNFALDETGTIYTITIKEGVYWHDGEKLTADDVAFTIDLIKNPETRSVIVGWNNISVNVVDEMTLTLTLSSVYASFEHALTFAVLPKHLLEDIAPNQLRENEFSQNPIGSGPFKFRFKQSVPDEDGQKIIYMARNDGYFKGRVNLEKFQLNIYSGIDEVIEALYSNKVNATAELSPIDIKKIDTSKYKISVTPIQNGVYALINTKSTLLSDANIRQALRLATDIDKIIEKLPENTNKISLPFTNGQLFGENIPVTPGFDLISAKKILDDAGWTLNSEGIRQKDGVDLKIEVVTMKGDEYEQNLQILAGQWRNVGFVVETKILDSADQAQNIAQNVLQPRNYDVLIYELEIGADPDVYAYWNSTQISTRGLNFSNYSNIISDDALKSARSRLEKSIRNAKYITFAKQWISDVPAIGLYQSTVQYVYGKNVKTFNPDNVFVISTDRYSDIFSWAVGETTVYKTP